MKLTLDLMQAFVRCPFKAFLKSTGQAGFPTEYELLESRLADAYQGKAIQQLMQPHSRREVALGPLSLEDALKGRRRLMLNVISTSEHRSITIPAIERLVSGRQTDYAIVTFSPANKVTRPTRLFAALLATALKSWKGLPVSCAKVVFGPRYSTSRLGLSGSNGFTRLGNEARSSLIDLEALAVGKVVPKLFLNAHCAICEFKDRCRKDATERDDLSLLTGLQPKEVETWNERGIFTVTQLAHTFRPKTAGRASHNPKRHSLQLQAMAVRDKTTYVRKRPELPAQATKVYLDVEGIPDTGLYYLIGLLVINGGERTQERFWGDSGADEEAIWHGLLSFLKQLDDYAIVHFGRYERDFVKDMFQRYGGNGGVSEEELLARLFDVHAAIRTNIFFPVYSNGLKDIASFLGFQWQGPIRSGLESIVWRYKWDETQDATVKDALLRYNHEDCLGVMLAFDYLASLSHTSTGKDMAFQETEGLPNSRMGVFGPMTFALPSILTVSAFWIDLIDYPATCCRC